MNDFLQNVLKPCLKFHSQIISRTIEDIKLSDTISAGQDAAISAFHFTEIFPDFKWTDAIAKELQSKLGDVANTKKHRIRKDPKLQIEITAGIAFEFIEDKSIRYHRKYIVASNQRFGSFDLYDTIAAYLPILAAKVGWKLGDLPKIVHDEGFAPYVVLEVPDAFLLEGFHLTLLQKNDEGEMIPTDHPFFAGIFPRTNEIGRVAVIGLTGESGQLRHPLPLGLDEPEAYVFVGRQS
ncbi:MULTISPECIES: hypothetical protein [unclassified Ensifer]|uniref:hypothetical protein n=1 Tax=unclassified Ensifer TaxID=2633371 RepID=UPI00300F7DFD